MNPRSLRTLCLQIVACLFGVLVLTFLAPEDAQIGGSVKVVYLHAALMWICIAALTATGLVAGAYLKTKGRAYERWSSALAAGGLLLLVPTLVLGMASARMLWGGGFWHEPRVLMSLKLLAFGTALLVAGTLSGTPTVRAGANVVLTLTTWGLSLTTERVVHPKNPIFSSDSLAIKIFPVAISLLLAVAFVQAIRMFFLLRPLSQKNPDV